MNYLTVFMKFNKLFKQLQQGVTNIQYIINVTLHGI